MPRDFSQVEVPVQEDEVCQVLRRAADVLRCAGHLKNALYVESPVAGPVCAMGAINRADHGSAKYGFGEMSQTAARALSEFLGLEPWASADKEWRWSETVASWNNAPERTAAEVIAALEGAADARAERLMREGK